MVRHKLNIFVDPPELVGVFKTGSSRDELNVIFLKLAKHHVLFFFNHLMEAEVKIIDRYFLNLTIFGIKTSIIEVCQV